MIGCESLIRQEEGGKVAFDPEAVRQFEHSGWRQVAPVYDNTFANASGLFVEPLIEAVQPLSGQCLLDVCCGTGLAAASAVRRGATVTGVDFSQEMLSKARDCNPGVQFDLGDAEALPYPNDCFDAAVSNFGIHHVPRPILAVQQIHRILRPGGRFAFTNWASPAENVAWRLVFDAIAAHGDRSAADAPPSGGNIGSLEAMRQLLTECRFRDVQVGLVSRQWLLRDAAEIVDTLERGTVRTAAIIKAQTAAVRSAIVAAVRDAARQYRRGDELAVPVVAILARGTR